jgi:hypothetical protein
MPSSGSNYPPVASFANGVDDASPNDEIMSILQDVHPSSSFVDTANTSLAGM